MHFLTRSGIPRFESPQLATETTNDDTAEVFTTNGTLYLPTWALESPLVLAHELGHVFGLGDDYTRNANGTVSSLPGRERTLMDDGFVIDQALIDRLGDLARRSGAQLPQCWEGTATIATSAVYPEGGTSCQDGWELEFTFVVTGEGTIDGLGTADLTSTPTCSFPIDPTPWQDHAEYRVLGEETAGGFSLRFALAPPGLTPNAGAQVGGLASIFSVPASPSGGPPVAVAVSGNSGTGRGMWQFETTATYSANGTIEVECVTCEDAAG
jgi:hypothetical protein